MHIFICSIILLLINALFLMGSPPVNTTVLALMFDFLLRILILLFPFRVQTFVFMFQILLLLPDHLQEEGF
jgi:hypothetical protein